MAESTIELESPRARAPRGTRAVADAFFTALDMIPAARRQDVAKAAQAIIRTGLKSRRDEARLLARQAKLDAAVPKPVALRRASKANGKHPPAARATGRRARA